MLKQLYIKNFAIIQECMIEWHEGMTVLTGETGAGKSIIIDAIGQLIGDRFASHFIRDTADLAFVEGVFDLSLRPDLVEKLEENGFSLEDQMMIVSKEMKRDGKSTYRLNYRQITQNFVRDLLSFVDIHSQHDNQYLLNQKMHLPLLDRFIVSSNESFNDSFNQSYLDYLTELKALKQMEEMVVDLNQLDFLTFQLNEIDQLDLQEHEIEQLEVDIDRVKHLEKYQKIIQTLTSMIDDEQGISAMLYQGERVIDLDDVVLNEVQQLFSDAYYKMEEARDLLNKLGDDLTSQDLNLEEIQERFFEVNKIKRKYGQTYLDIMDTRQTLALQVELISDYESKLDSMRKVVALKRSRAIEEARILTDLRKERAVILETMIQDQLSELELTAIQFIVHFEEQDLSKNGSDAVTFYISLNAGQVPKPLHQVASGGELSRVMLGLKAIFSMLNRTGMIVFDEVDTGVSGKVASAIGKKMASISNHLQVLCITHLPQVAGCATNHLHVSKQVEDGDTIVAVDYLDYDGRIQELAKMLSGTTINEQALANAKALIKHEEV